jgi:hypothetical protein
MRESSRTCAGKGKGEAEWVGAVLVSARQRLISPFLHRPPSAIRHSLSY